MNHYLPENFLIKKDSPCFSPCPKGFYAVLNLPGNTSLAWAGVGGGSFAQGS